MTDDLANVRESLACSECKTEHTRGLFRPYQSFKLLPRRKIDNTIVSIIHKVNLKTSLHVGETRPVPREKGVEMQYQLLCPNCNRVLVPLQSFLLFNYPPQYIFTSHMNVTTTSS